ncbi:MAG: L,D-transpeptidase family protein [Anaerolineae bacterium]|nr:L,D-transpeptidase family protein [Anaerolineae bacterium]
MHTNSSQPSSYFTPVDHRPVSARRSPTFWLIAGGVGVAGIITLISLAALVWVALSPSHQSANGSASQQVVTAITLPAGVQVAGVPLGDQTVGQAEQTLAYYAIPNRTITLRDGARTWMVTLDELGIGVDIPLTVQRATEAAPNTQIQPWYTVDLSQTQHMLVSLTENINMDAAPGVAGRVMDVPVMLNRLYENLEGEIADSIFELSMIETEPLAETTQFTSNYNGPTTTHIVEAGQELALIARLYGVAMADIVALNALANPDLLWVGQELAIPAQSIYTPTAADAPAAPTSAGKSIVVSTDQQRIYAYENGQLVHSYLTSTGLPATPTVKGDFKIYVKYVTDDMSGPDYYLPDVPYTMYFYQGYGIHGTYWHNSFGRPMSHGCVNLPTDQAEWFFNWAEVGTPVRVI